MAYNDSLNPDDQISAEEEIAFLIFNFCSVDEEDCSLLGKDILHLVLKRFRPDLIDK